MKFGKADAAHEEVVDACKKARCHDFIEELPDSYNTVIGEGGSTLSGGEKQRISIARAIIKNAPIIISFAHGQLFHGEAVLEKLEYKPVAVEDIILKPALLKKILLKCRKPFICLKNEG